MLRYALIYNKKEYFKSLDISYSKSTWQRRIYDYCNIQDGKPLTIITKPSILDVAAALDPPLLGNKINFDGNKKKFALR